MAIHTINQSSNQSGKRLPNLFGIIGSLSFDIYADNEDL